MHRRPAAAFTLVELLSIIAIIAALTAAVMFFTVSYVQWSKTISDQRTLLVLNDALNRYKTEGGGVAGLTANATLSRILTALQSTITYGNHGHNVMQAGVTFRGKSIGSTGTGAQYHFSRFNSYADGSGDATNGTGGGVAAPSNAVANGGFETGDLSGWTTDGQESIVTSPICPVHSGTHACALGTGGYAHFSQTVTVPTGATLKSYIFAAGADYPAIKINFKGITVYNGFGYGMGSYAPISVNMSAYAGQSGTLDFIIDDSQGDSTTGFYFDDITLQ